MYKVKNWNDLYENAQSRKVKDLAWVPVPTRHDGERYTELMLHKNAAEIFTAWILILQVAARSQCRGSLMRNDGSEHTPSTLAIKTRGKKEWFELAIPLLMQLSWLEQVTTDSQNTPTLLPFDWERGGEERKKEGTEISPMVVEVISYLNEKAGTNFRMVDSNSKLIMARIKEGASLDDLKSVIDLKVKDWIGKEESKYLRPETLFNATKFNSYLGLVGVQIPKKYRHGENI